MKDITIPPTIVVLTHAASGLLLSSETDAPFEPFFWPQEESPPKETTLNAATTSKATASNAATRKEIIPKEAVALTPNQLVQLADLPPDTPIKSVKLETFFRPATREQGWHNREEKAQAQKFKAFAPTISRTICIWAVCVAWLALAVVSAQADTLKIERAIQMPDGKPAVGARVLIRSLNTKDGSLKDEKRVITDEQGMARAEIEVDPGDAPQPHSYDRLHGSGCARHGARV